MVASDVGSKTVALYSVRQVAEACGVTGQTIKRWEKAKKIPAHVTKESNGNWFFTEAAKNAAVRFASAVAPAEG